MSNKLEHTNLRTMNKDATNRASVSQHHSHGGTTDETMHQHGDASAPEMIEVHAHVVVTGYN